MGTRRCRRNGKERQGEEEKEEEEEAMTTNLINDK